MRQLALTTFILSEDALATRSTVIGLIEHQGKNMTVMMHSYGGVVETEAVSANLSATTPG